MIPSLSSAGLYHMGLGMGLGMGRMLKLALTSVLSLGLIEKKFQVRPIKVGLTPDCGRLKMWKPNRSPAHWLPFM